MPRPASVPLPPRKLEYTSTEPLALIFATNASEVPFRLDWNASTTGNFGDSVKPVTYRFSARSSATAMAPSLPGASRQPAYTSAVPVGLSLATNPAGSRHVGLNQADVT